MHTHRRAERMKYKRRYTERSLIKWQRSKQVVSVVTSEGKPSSSCILSSWKICHDLEFMKAFTSEPDATFTLQSVNLMHCKSRSQVPYFWMFAKSLPLESWLYVPEQMYMSSFTCSWKARWLWPNKLAFAVFVPCWLTFRVVFCLANIAIFLGTLLRFVHRKTFCNLVPKSQCSVFGLLF